MSEFVMTQQSETAVVVLAAGLGTRMRSDRAKVLHEICGRPMLGYIQQIAGEVAASRLIVVVGRDADEVREIYGDHAEFVLQAEQKGTGHAVMMAEPLLRAFAGDVLILYGDTPLLRAETLLRMRELKRETDADLVVLTANADNIPGRAVRDAEGRLARIVESQDASEAELAIAERNTGVYLVSADLLWEGLGKIDTHNRQGELYITDVVNHAISSGRRVEALWTPDGDECLGVNDRAELAAATLIMRRRINRALMADGVTLIDPESTYIDATVKVGRDTVIEPGCFITGNSVIGSGVEIKANCYIEDSRLDDGVVFGPYSHLRPNCHLMRDVKIGNFVEVKNSTLGAGSKSAHLTYIGDATVGEKVNFGCGSVVVNYDGYQKHHTIVGDGVFVGCNVNLIAPVEIEPNAFLAAGSTLSQRVPTDALAVARARQRNIEGWVARREGRATRAPERDAKSGAEPEQAGAPAPPNAAEAAAVTARGARGSRAKIGNQSTRKRAAKKTKKSAARKRAAAKTKQKAARKRAAKSAKKRPVREGTAPRKSR